MDEQPSVVREATGETCTGTRRYTYNTLVHTNGALNSVLAGCIGAVDGKHVMRSTRLARDRR